MGFNPHFKIIADRKYLIPLLKRLLAISQHYVTAPAMDGVYGINKYSMANISLGGLRLWASVAFAYIFNFIFLYYLFKEYENFARVRSNYFALYISL